MVLFSLLLSACDEVQGLFETPEELPSVVEQIPEEEIAAHWEEVRDPAPEDKGQQ